MRPWLILFIAAFFSSYAAATESGWVCSYPAYKWRPNQPDSIVQVKFVRNGKYFISDQYKEKYLVVEDNAYGVIAAYGEAWKRSEGDGTYSQLFMIDKETKDFRIVHMYFKGPPSPPKVGTCSSF